MPSIKGINKFAFDIHQNLREKLNTCHLYNDFGIGLGCTPMQYQRQTLKDST